MNSKYPNLLSPGTIGSLEIRNKTVMCAMGMSQSDQGFVNQAVINPEWSRQIARPGEQ